MVYLAVVALTLLLFGNGAYRRHHDGLPTDSEYLSRVFFDALGLATAIVGVLIALWLTIAVVVRGGSIDSNVPAGVSVDSILGLMIVGACMTAIYTFSNYRERVYPLKMVERQLGGDEPLSDAAPLERGPEDAPR